MKELCLKLASAVSEDEIDQIINSDPILKNNENWKQYGNINNIGTVTGQSPQAVPSLVEKITNSIDALLIKACKDHGHNPEDSTCPKSMVEALHEYFDLDDNKYCDLSDKERRSLASNIQVIAEGSRSTPAIAIYDNGEGQNPQEFPNTFVSIGKNNKRKIHFVQGKYNMGGTAVLPFCGSKRYQLIISRKNQPLKSNNNPFGFTIVRRNRGSEDDKISWYEYCVDPNGKIFEFLSDPLDLGLYHIPFPGGTYIKLFNYDLRNNSNITLDLWKDLNRYLFKPALPILIYEKRDYKGHTPTKIMHGNRMRAFIDSRENVEKIFKMEITVNKVKFPIEIYVFKADVNTKEFIQDMAVIFNVNGQVQHSLDNRFVSQNAKKAYLKGSLLISVDCSKMPRELHEDTFMSSRAAMRDNNFYRSLVDMIAKEINDNEYLTALDEQRRKDQIFQNPNDEEFLKNIMGKLLREDKEIEKLLGFDPGIFGNEVKKITKQIDNGKTISFIGKRYPTYFKFKNLQEGNIKMLPQNGESKIDIETDVEDEYLIRPHDKGELKVRVMKPHLRSGKGSVNNGGLEDEEVLDVNIVGPNNGHVKLRVKTRDNLPIGAEMPVNIELSSPEGPHILTAHIKIDNPHDKTKESEIKTKKEYSLPTIVEVYKTNNNNGKQIKTWDDSYLNWNETDICKVQESSKEGILIDAVYINMEPKELQNYIRMKKIDGQNIQRITRTYKVNIYLVTLVLYYQLLNRLNKFKKENSNEQETNYESVDMTSHIMKGVSKIILHITSNDKLLKELEEIGT